MSVSASVSPKFDQCGISIRASSCERLNTQRVKSDSDIMTLVPTSGSSGLQSLPDMHRDIPSSRSDGRVGTLYTKNRVGG